MNNFIQFGIISYNSKIVQYRTKIVQSCTIRVCICVSYEWDFEQLVQYCQCVILLTDKTRIKFISIFLYLLTADMLPQAEKTSTLMRTFFRLRAFLPYNWKVFKYQSIFSFHLKEFFQRQNLFFCCTLKSILDWNIHTNVYCQLSGDTNVYEYKSRF